MVYPSVIGAGRALLAGLGLDLRVEGDERVPTTGPVVLAANHTSFLDFVLLGLVARRSRRYVRFLARHDLWQHPAAGTLMRRMRHVPVDRSVPAHALLVARRLLLDGEAVGIFPEAGISMSLTVRPVWPGAVALAQATGAPLLPVVLDGAQRIATARRPLNLRRNLPVTIVVGEALRVDDVDVRTGTRRLGSTLQDMLESVQRRPVHRPLPREDAWWWPASLGGSAPTPTEASRLESTRSRWAISYGAEEPGPILSPAPAAAPPAERIDR